MKSKASNQRATLLVGLVAAFCVFGTAAGAYFDAGGPDAGGDMTDPLAQRETVSIRIEPVGAMCVRAVQAVGFDPRLNRPLYRVALDSGPMASLGVVAYQNAFSSVRTQADAAKAASQARSDSAPYRRDLSQCGRPAPAR